MPKLASRLLFSLISSAAVALVASCGVNTHATDPTGAGNTAKPHPTEHLAVADQLNNRVLLYSVPLSTDESASVVIGQATFSCCIYQPTAPAKTVGAPASLSMDGSGNLYVADPSHCRVLQFQPPFATDMRASLVIGQPQFMDANSPDCRMGGANGLMNPVSVAVDGSGDLWVADPDASRVTEYVQPFKNGMAAELSIGQTTVEDTYYCNGSNDYTHSPHPTARTLCGPAGVAFDAKGDLWVSDTDNLRILEFIPPFSTGMAASLELGQPAATGFTSVSVTAPTASSFYYPEGLAFDSSGDLWVSDSYGNRVMEFVPPFSNGMAASLVLGQPDFTHASQADAANGMNHPEGLFFDSKGNLIVADQENSRVLIFSPPFSSGMSATIAIGQPTMTSGTCLVPVAANTLCSPHAVLAF